MSDGITQEGRWMNRVSYLLKQERALTERVKMLEDNVAELALELRAVINDLSQVDALTFPAEPTTPTDVQNQLTDVWRPVVISYPLTTWPAMYGGMALEPREPGFAHQYPAKLNQIKEGKHIVPVTLEFVNEAPQVQASPDTVSGQARQQPSDPQRATQEKAECSCRRMQPTPIPLRKP